MKNFEESLTWNNLIFGVNNQKNQSSNNQLCINKNQM